MGRRLANMSFTPELFVKITCGAYVVINNPVPVDAHVWSCAWCPERGVFVVTLESAHFDEVRECDQIPEISGPRIKKLDGPVERYL